MAALASAAPSRTAGAADQRYLRNFTSSPFACSLSGFNSSLFEGGSAEALRELVVSFECAQTWIENEGKRVNIKKQIAADIEDFCKNHSLNKHRLLAQKRTGYYLALFAAIRFRPEDRDWELIMKLASDRIPPGFAYYKLLDAVEAIKNSGNVTPNKLRQVQGWLNALPDRSKDITLRINALVK